MKRKEQKAELTRWPTTVKSMNQQRKERSCLTGGIEILENNSELSCLIVKVEQIEDIESKYTNLITEEIDVKVEGFLPLPIPLQAS